MKLIELNPKIVNEVLHLNCPKCKNHNVAIPLINSKQKRTWSIYNREDWNNVELRPSITLDCCHFNITNGEVRGHETPNP